MEVWLQPGTVRSQFNEGCPGIFEWFVFLGAYFRILDITMSITNLKSDLVLEVEDATSSPLNELFLLILLRELLL
jgi:hypothetical protein